MSGFSSENSGYQDSNPSHHLEHRYSKGVEFKDAPIVDPRFYEQPAWVYYANGPRMHEFLREMNEEVLNQYDAVTVGELPHTPDPNKVLQYVGAGDKQLSMVFQFDIVDLGQGKDHKYHFEEWKLSELKAIVSKWQYVNSSSLFPLSAPSGAVGSTIAPELLPSLPKQEVDH